MRCDGGGSARWQFGVVAGVMLFCSAVQAVGEEPFIYRRVLVPADSIDSQIRGLLPLKRDEFERRIILARQMAPHAGEAVVRLEEASFRARLDGTQLTGSATLSVVNASGQTVALALAPRSFAVESVHWSNREPRTAVFGADEDGRLLCLVDQSGALELRWNQPATTNVAGHLTFEMEFPGAPRRRMIVSAPAGLELAVDSGLIVASEPSATEPGRREWTIELTGRSELGLETFPEHAKQAALSRAVVRDSTVYHILPTVVDLETTLNIDVLQDSIQSLALSSEQAARVLSVQIDGRPARFHVEQEGDGGRNRYEVELPASLIGVNHTVMVTATAARNTDRASILPRVLPVGVHLEEGSAEITAPSWLQLCPRPLRDCVQTAAISAPSGRNVDRFEFLLFSPEAAIEVASSRASPPLIEDSGTQIHFEPNQVTGVFIADLSSAAPGLFSVEAQVAKPWIIDSIETQPSESLADRTTTSGTGGFQGVKLQLNRPITNVRPLRVTIRAHTRRPAIEELLDENFFRFARFGEARGGRQWLSIAVFDPNVHFELRSSLPAGAVFAEQLNSYERSLFEDEPGQIFAAGAALADLRATLAPAKPRYHADVLITAEVGLHNVTQRASIHCRPDGSSVPSVLIGLVPAPAGEMTWRLAGDMQRELPATLERSSMAAGESGAFYRVLLPRMQVQPFELTGEWSAPLITDTSISLAWLPEAAHQQSILGVQVANSRSSVRVSDVQPLPVVDGARNRDGTWRGRYQYDAGRRGTATIHMAANESDAPRAWVETLRLASRFSADGRGEHVASLVVHPAGEQAIQFHLPASAMHCRLVNENGEEESLESGGGEFRLRARLDAAAERTTLRIRYASDAVGSGLWPSATLVAPILQTNAIVLDQQWEVCMPPQYSTAARTGRSQRMAPESRPQPFEWRWQSFVAALAGPALTERLANVEEVEQSTAPGFEGWKIVRLELGRGAEAKVWVYRADVVAGWFWCLAICGAALASCLGRWPRWISVLAFVSVAMAVVFGPPWTFLAEGLAIGVAIGGMQLLLVKHRSPSLLRWTTTGNSALLNAQATVSAAILVAVSLGGVFAAPPESRPVPERRPKVVIPVDANQEPKGDYVYLDELLYDRLHQSLDHGVANVPSWLLESAHYEVPAAPQPRGDKAAFDEVRMSFDLYTFHEASVVRLPLTRDQVILLEGRARLDGQPAKLTWRPDGGELSLAVAEAGKHRLELAVGAAARQEDDGLHLDLSVPVAAHATVRLPIGAKLLTAASGNVAGVQPAANPIFHGRKLRLLWPQAHAETVSNANFEAEQLSLWRVHWGSVVLESQFRLKPNGKPMREVVVECDPRLRVLPLLGANPIGRLNVQEGATSTVKIEFAEPIVTETSLRLTWLWPDATGLGQWQLPRVKLRADRMLRSWAAIAIEPGLSLVRSPLAESPTTAEFGAAFGESDVRQIAAAWDDANGESRLVECKPDIALPQAEEGTELSCSQANIVTTFTAHLTSVPRHRFEHRISVPANMRVTQATVMERGKAAAIRWEQAADGTVVVLMLESPEPEQTVKLVAELPLKPEERRQFRAPRITIQEADRRAAELRVFRQSDVQASVSESVGWSATERLDGSYESEKGRRVALLRSGASGNSTPSIAISANRPKVTGQMLIRVGQSDGEWTWEADLDLIIADGVLDEFTLSLPGELTGNIEVTPEMDQLNGGSRDNRRRLVLRPRDALSGQAQIRLSGTLESGAEGLTAPDIFLENVPDLKRIVVLERNGRGNQFDWDVAGLVALDEASRQSLPSWWQPLSGDWFQATARQFSAIAHVRHASQNKIHIPLADVRGALHDRRLVITAHMIVLPTAGSELRFSLPEGCRLLETIADGSNVPHAPAGLRSWKLAGMNDVLPYHLTIVYDTFLPHHSIEPVRFHLAAPQFAAATTEQALLSIENNGERGQSESRNAPLRASTGGTAIAPCEAGRAELIRLKALARAMEELTTAQDGSIPPTIVAELFLRWERMFLDVHRRLLEAAQDEEDGKTWLEEAIPSLEVVRKIRQRLEHAGLDNKGSLAFVLPAKGAGQGAVKAVPTWLRSGSEEIEVLLPGPTEPENAGRSLVTLGLLTFAAAMIVVPSKWFEGSSVLANRHFLVALAAVAWWLLAPLGWLGLVVLLIDGWDWIRSPRNRENEERGSSIVRSTVIR